MSDVTRLKLSLAIRRYAAAVALIDATYVPAPSPHAHDTPLISGGVGFLTSTNGGNASPYLPVLSPLLAAPIGSHVLVESRANLFEVFHPKGNGQIGYTSAPFLNLTFLQGDFLVSPHLTIVAGDFLTPFATYNERLSPIWIGNFEDGPLIIPLGTMGTDSSVGGMVRGSAVSAAKYSVDYAAYFSATSTNLQFNSERSSGGRASVYFPEAGLEVGGSYGRLLQGTHQNFAGFHVWWEPIDSPFRLRSEYAHGEHAQGYWIESDYRLSHFGGVASVVGRLEPLFRMQQTFRNSPDQALPACLRLTPSVPTSGSITICRTRSVSTPAMPGNSLPPATSMCGRPGSSIAFSFPPGRANNAHLEFRTVIFVSRSHAAACGTDQRLGYCRFDTRGFRQTRQDRTSRTANPRRARLSSELLALP